MVRRGELRRRWSLAEIQIPIGWSMGPVRGVFIGSNDSAVDSGGGGTVSRSGGVGFISALDLHASKALPVSPLQNKVR